MISEFLTQFGPQFHDNLKKATSSGFTYDVSICGLYYDDMDEVDGGVPFGLGYAW